MVNLLVGNLRTEEMIGDLQLLTAEAKLVTGCAAQSLIWFAGDGDVAVLPWAPDPDYVSYVCTLTGTNPASLRIVIPPSAPYDGILDAGRLRNPQFLNDLDQAIAGRGVDKIIAFYPDELTATLARQVGATAALPGHAFLTQHGSAIANSKATFRAVANGIGCPVPEGSVCADRFSAERQIANLLAKGPAVVVKREFHGAGDGNEILVTDADISVEGTRLVRFIDQGSTVSKYVTERWDWLTDNGKHRAIVERYHIGSTPVFADFIVSDSGVIQVGHGQMLMDPAYVGVIVPAPDLTDIQRKIFFDESRRICTAFGAIGFRGTMGVDGIRTADGKVLLNEVNGRFTGSTHLFQLIGRRLIGEDFLERRVIIGRSTLKVPSFSSAITLIKSNELSYDPQSRCGVILVCDYGKANKTVKYYAVAESLAAAREYDKSLREIFTGNE